MLVETCQVGGALFLDDNTRIAIRRREGERVCVDVTALMACCASLSMRQRDINLAVLVDFTPALPRALGDVHMFWHCAIRSRSRSVKRSSSPLKRCACVYRGWLRCGRCIYASTRRDRCGSPVMRHRAPSALVLPADPMPCSP
jgi:hypothetical protein